MSVQFLNNKHKRNLKPLNQCFSDENFPGNRFKTQIRLNKILTLATKHLMIIIINKDNFYQHLKTY